MGCAEEKVTVYKGGPIGHGGRVIVAESELQALFDEIKSLDVGEGFEIVKEQMTRIELESLPEHTGW